jgi:hypothetical protein
MRSNPENLFRHKAKLDFRGSSKNNANQRFAVFRDQLSYLAKINMFKEHLNHAL